MRYTDAKIFKLYEQTTNLGPQGDNDLTPNNNNVINIPSGFATKDDSQNKPAGKSIELLKDIIPVIIENKQTLESAPGWVKDKLALAAQYLEDVAAILDKVD